MLILRGILIYALMLVAPAAAWAILPPSFFVQGLTSISAIIAGAIGVTIGYFFIFWRIFKIIASKYKRVILFLLIQNIVIAALLCIIFYWGFYKPLYKTSYLYQTQNSNSQPE
ncbi:MAG: hypothetical protein V1884_00780 [Candidatus Omnitrophota bacterium]